MESRGFDSLPAKANHRPEASLAQSEENVLFPETKTVLSLSFPVAKAALPPANRIANANAVIECKMRLMTLSFVRMELSD
jgi:hypothetical protein